MSRALVADVFSVSVGGPQIFQGDYDPSQAPGVPAPLASQYLRSDGSRWAKVGPADTDWLRSSFFTTTTNGDSTTIAAGEPVIIMGTSARRANAASASLSTVVGLALANAAPTLPLIVVTGTELVLITSAWDVITGQSGGLTAGATYFLAPVLGMLTVTPPGAAGQSVCAVGRALSATEFHVAPQAPIYL